MVKMLLTKLGIALLAITAIGMTQTAEADATEQVDVITMAQPCDNKKTIVTVVETPEVEQPAIEQPAIEQPVVEQPTQDETQALQEAQEAVKEAQEAQTQAEHEALEAQLAAEANAKAAQEAAQQAQEANTWTCDKCGQQIQNNIPKEVHDKAMHAEQQAEPQEEATQYDGICEKCGSTFVGSFDEHVCQK